MIIEAISVFVVGLLVGGIVNVLADDLPLRRAIRLPRYVSDDKKRAIHRQEDEASARLLQQDDEKRPVIAWLGISAFLSGKRTSPAGIKLSWRYPLAELLTAVLMAITVIEVNKNTDFAGVGFPQLIFWLIYMAILALITVIDIEHKLILFIVTIPAAVIAIVDALLGEFLDAFYGPSLGEALIGGVIGFVVFFILYNGGFLFTYILGKLKKRKINEVALGYGDVMLMTVSGLILGWQALLVAMYLTVILGAIGATLYLLSRLLLGRKYHAFTALPYGPYIVASTIITLLLGIE